MHTQDTASPFHRSEHELQSRLGVRERVEDLGQRFIRDYMPDEHRAFYAQLPYVLIGSIDQSGRPWASILVGHPGFISSPGPDRLKIETPLIFGDPLNDNLSPDLQIGLLGIEYHSRRRNRLTGKLVAIHERGVEIKIDQTFGNCPQYIQARKFSILPEIEQIGAPRPIEIMERLNDPARQIVAKSDNFYIATHYSEDPKNASHGTDISHRGGRPGFVKIEEDNTIVFPDFSGNNHFNTLGNIRANPVAGLLFIDFNSGDLLYLTGRAKIIWDGELLRTFDGAERLVRIALDQARLIKAAMPIRWDFVDNSPSLEKTGTWQQVDERLAARNAGNIYREYTVFRVVPESENIVSFYLEPQHSDQIHCHKAGQFLPIEVQPPETPEPIHRTYTISNAPNGKYFRLTIKREPPTRPNVTPGLASNYFHDFVEPGTTIRAMSPRGKFALDKSSTRPIVLISAGVGITPMISMLEQLANDRLGCGCNRKVWFIHATQNGKTHAFASAVRKLTENWQYLSSHICYSKPGDDDVKGSDYHSSGHVGIDLIKSLLPLDDYEYYLCGPAPFMQSVFDGLTSLNIDEKRIHYEFFGDGSTLHKNQPQKLIAEAEAAPTTVPVPVRFAKSGIETVWEKSKGSLLELAESEGINPHYGCRSGVCQTCTTTIIEGQVDYSEPPMDEPEANKALICCCVPRTETDINDRIVPLILDL